MLETMEFCIFTTDSIGYCMKQKFQSQLQK
ncbi:MAG: hypothetical protein LBS52_06030 [Dysgonamonadaceae bacterium]|nr:hypothetical protein [Dysgonamonadaceae bacterium]